MSRKMNFESLCRLGEVSGPVSFEAIAHAEEALEVRFPNEYKEFLNEFGAACFDGMEIYGLPDPEKNDPPLWQSVIHVTQQLRKLGQVEADKKILVPFSDDGTGVYFYFDTAVSPDTRVWAIGPGLERIVASSLYDFVIDMTAAGKVTL